MSHKVTIKHYPTHYKSDQAYDIDITIDQLIASNMGEVVGIKGDVFFRSDEYPGGKTITGEHGLKDYIMSYGFEIVIEG